MKNSLLPGDIVFELQPRNHAPNHVWIYGSPGDSKERNPRVVIHSSQGKTLSAVGRHTLAEHFVTGPACIFRVRDPELRKYILLVAESFAPLLTSKQVGLIASLDPEEDAESKLNIWKETEIPLTPFSLARMSDSSGSSSIKESLSIFRSVRAALRSHGSKIQPLSKKQGVSCNQFMSYIVQAGIILFLLKDKVELLKELTNKISDIGVKNLNRDNLDLVDLLAKFLRQLISKAKKITLMTDSEIEKIITFPSKGSQINRFLELMKSSQLFEQLSVNLELKKDKDGLQPYFSEQKAPEKTVSKPSSFAFFQLNKEDEDSDEDLDRTKVFPKKPEEIEPTPSEVAEPDKDKSSLKTGISLCDLEIIDEPDIEPPNLVRCQTWS